jgi:hypothetical protein
MKVGDLVRLSLRKTRRGIGYEEQIGVVLKVAINNVVTVNFAGIVVHLGIEDVEVISESG